jgi:hypothetical protein
VKKLSGNVATSNTEEEEVDTKMNLGKMGCESRTLIKLV